MANILLLDDNEVACHAMQGILTRGHHRCLIANDAETAWRMLRDLLKIDLVFLELKLSKGDNGIHFLDRLRNDVFLKHVPVVVYSAVTHPDIVKKALSMKVQNYLIKPYRDESIYAEIEKEAHNPWRNLHFEEEKSFCTQLGIKPDDLKKSLQELGVALRAAVEPLTECGQAREADEAVKTIDVLVERGEAVGAWGVVEYLQGLKAKVEMHNWPSLIECKPDFDYASLLIDCHLDPNLTPEGFLSDQERKDREETNLRASWVEADVSQGPLVHASEVERKLDELQACPAIDTVVANFLMNCDGRAPSLNQLIELVSKDPWMTAQVIITANHLEHDEMTAIEDIRLAVTMTGYEKLAAMAKTMPLVEERHMRVPGATWAHYWMFQVAVARVAQFAATSLELTNVATNAYAAGLMHDFGRLVLTKLYPYSFLAAVTYAKQHNVPLREAEKKYVGWSTREAGDYFAQRQGLPSCYCNVIRWVGTPAECGGRADLVALVTLARDLCITNQIGFSGERVPSATTLEESPAWTILRENVFPSFNLKKFESQTHYFCATLKQELIGHIESPLQ